MTRQKIKPVRRISRGYIPDDQRYERNSRLVDPADAVKSVRRTFPESGAASGGTTGSGSIGLFVNGSMIGSSTGIDVIGSGGGAEVSGFVSPNGRPTFVVRVPKITSRQEILKMISYRG